MMKCPKAHSQNINAYLTNHQTTRGISLDAIKLPTVPKYETPKYSSKGPLPLYHPSPQAKEKVHSFSPNRINTDNSLIPPLKLSDKQPLKTLVLDLDETLIHSSFAKFPIDADLTLQVDLENQVKEIYVLLRPSLDDFLARVSKCYEIVIFTAGLSKYANMLIDIIDKRSVCKYRLFREQCTLINNIYVKELKRLNRNLKNVIILDNNPNAFSLDNDNGIPIKSFIGDKTDNELIQMAYVLEKLSKVNDVRPFIKDLVYMNQIDYDKAFELFKHKDNNDDIIKSSNNDKGLIQFNDKTVSLTDSNGSKAKPQVKILSVEKIDTKPVNSLMIGSNTTTNSVSFNSSLSALKGINKTCNSFYSSNISKSSQSNDMTGKLFRSLAQRSRSKEGLHTPKNEEKLSPFSKCNINQNSKNVKVKLLPKNITIQKDESNGINTNGNEDNMLKKKTKSTLNQKDDNKRSTSKDFKSIDIKDITKRPASVIPLKANLIGKKNDDIKELSQSYLDKQKGKEKKTNNSQNTTIKKQKGLESTTYLNEGFKSETSNNKSLVSKGTSSRVSLHNNLPLASSHPRTERKKPLENSQSLTNSKISFRTQSKHQKNNKVTLKLINSKNNPTYQSKSDFKILKIVSNKPPLALNRSKTSLDKSNPSNVNNNNNKPSNIK